MTEPDRLLISWVDEQGNELGQKQHGPLSGWSPVGYAEGAVAWCSSAGAGQLWKLDEEGNRIGSVDYPSRGYRLRSYANGKLLWERAQGGASLWTLDAEGTPIAHKEHGPFPGWRPVNHEGNHLLFRHEDGRASLWVIDEQGNQLSYKEHGPFAGWTPVHYAGGRLLFRHEDGRASLWVVDEQGNQLSYKEHGPFAGWTPVHYGDRRLSWLHDDGRSSTWLVDAQGAQIRYREHGPFGGASALVVEISRVVSAAARPHRTPVVSVGKPAPGGMTGGAGIDPAAPEGVPLSRWSEEFAVQGSFGTRNGGVAPLLSPGDEGPTLTLYYIDHLVHDDHQPSVAEWRYAQAFPLDTAGKARGFAQGKLSDNLLSNVIGTGGDLFNGFTFDFTRFSFEGASAAWLDGRALLFERHREGDEVPSIPRRPPFNHFLVLPAGSPAAGLEGAFVRDEGEPFLPASARDVRAAVGDVQRRDARDLVLVYLDGASPTKAHYRLGWKLAATQGQPLVAGGVSTDRDIPGDFPSAGLGAAIVTWGGARHLVVFSFELGPGQGRTGRYRVGHDLDAEGNVHRWGPWVRMEGLFENELQAASITVGDIELRGRPDLLVATSTHRANGQNVLRYRVGFNFLDIPPSLPVATFCPLPRAHVRSPLSVVSWGPGRLDLLVRSRAGNVLQKSFDQERWWPSPGAWSNLGWAPGGAFAEPPRAISWGAGRLDIFAVGPDGQMYQKSWDGAAWLPSAQQWQPLGGKFCSPATLLSRGPERLDVFALGNGGELFLKSWDGAAWSPTGQGWSSVGGRFLHPVVAVSRVPGMIEIFGIGTDGGMYAKTWNGGDWVPGGGDWTSLGGQFISAPAVVSSGPGRLDVFGIGTDGAMYQKTWDGQRWSPSGGDWASLGGGFVTSPFAVSRAPDQIDLFGLGNDEALYHSHWNGSTWTAWACLEGRFSSMPVVLSRNPVKLEVFGIGTDARVYQRSWTPFGWQPALWVPLGGPVALR
jgi:hypothetical protein